MANIHDIVTELTLAKAKLEAENRRLKADLKACTEIKNKYTDLYESAPVGYCRIDSNGLIRDANPYGVEFLSAGKTSCLQKPISLYIHEDDLVEYYLHQKKLLSEQTPQSFMIRLNRVNRSKGYALTTIFAFPVPGDKKPNIKLLFIDKTRERQCMDALQNKNNFLSFLFSIINEVAALTGEQKKAAIIENLEILALLLGVDRLFFVRLAKADMSVAEVYNWCGETVSPQFANLNEAVLRGTKGVFKVLGNRNLVELADIAAGAPAGYQKWLSLFPPRIRSVFRLAVTDRDRLQGILGYDCITSAKKVGEEELNLIKIAAKLLFYTIDNGSEAEAEDVLIYDGPIEIIEDTPAPAPVSNAGKPAARKARALNLVPCTFNDAKNLVKIFPPEQGKMMITCPACKKCERFDVADLTAMGKTIKAMCACGTETFLLIEMRSYYRKPVNLPGFFVHQSPKAPKMQTKENWGRIQIKNISKFGIGFELEGHQRLAIDDALTVKFNLDNNTNSMIRKDVTVRSVNDRYVGCRFEGKDRHDVTLGFYLMG